MRARTIRPANFLPHAMTILGSAAAGCSGSEIVLEPGTITLDLAPEAAIIPQGTLTTIDVVLTRSGDFTGAVVLTVSGAPVGVGTLVSDVQTVGSVTTARITIDVATAVPVGTYNLIVVGTGSGVSATATLQLTVTPPTDLPSQWATTAVASSQYTATDWSASQATGQPNVIGCSDDPLAWASFEPDGAEWLELGFQDAVRPTEIRIYESFGVSSLVKVEVKTEAGAYLTVYAAQAANLACPRVLTIPIAAIVDLVKVVRLSFDESILRNWNEIDAVRLTGYVPGPWDYLRPR
jgi:hypothetical protein